MGQQIIFFEKNKIDLERTDVAITVTDSTAINTGQAFVDFVRNRSNDSMWITTGSTDAGNTTLEISIGDEVSIDDILVVLHNWGSYTIQYWNGAAYQDFSTPVNESGYTEENSRHNFDTVTTTKIKIVIAGTQVPDSDKRAAQIIIASKLGAGELEYFPEIKRPTVSLNKVKQKMLSGKVNVIDSVGKYSVELKLKTWRSASDLSIVEDLYFRREGVLVWPCGGDEAQFSSVRRGFRFQDIYLVRPVNEWQPEWYNSIYQNGLKLSVKLEETIR